jgi:short-subunit dehydrogenase
MREVAGGHANAVVEPLDFTRSADVAAAWDRIRRRWGGVDLVLIVAGTHKEMRAWELNEKDSRALLEINLHAVINTTGALVPGFLAQGTGAIGIVASVAGYRGLPKALVYGASKAAVINFTETLYLDLHPKGLGVYLIMPGFVKTPLTDQNDFTMPHLISAEEAAREIVDGMRAGKFEIHFPRAFTRQLKLLRLLPYRWYFSLIRNATGL